MTSDLPGAQRHAFRFYVISSTAVFVAVALGLVLGTAAWSGPETESLRDQLATANSQSQVLSDRLANAGADVDARQTFAERLAPAVLGTRLGPAKVLILSTPTGKDYVDSVRHMLAVAGTMITGTVDVDPAFFEPAREDGLLDLATASLPPSVTGGLSSTLGGTASASALLAAVLLKREPAVTDPDLRSVLAAFTTRGFLAGTGGVTGAADAVVIVAGPPAPGGQVAERATALLTLVRQFDVAGAVVVAAGSDLGVGNPVTLVRGDPALSLTVSTVDNLNTPEGRLVAAWAVADQLTAKVGHYGSGTGVTLLPSPTP